MSQNGPAPIVNGWLQSQARQDAYRVKEGDTIYSIAWDFGLDYRAIATANGLVAPYALKTGQLLNMTTQTVASAQTSYQAVGSSYHPVSTTSSAMTIESVNTISNQNNQYPTAELSHVNANPTVEFSSQPLRSVNPPVVSQQPTPTTEMSQSAVSASVQTVVLPKINVAPSTEPPINSPTSAAPEADRSTIAQIPSASSTVSAPVVASVAPPANTAAPKLLAVAPTSPTVATTAPTASQHQQAPVAAWAPKVSQISQWVWPAQGKVVEGYSTDLAGNHGLNIAGVLNQPVYAAAAGRVVYSGTGVRGYGNLVIIKHSASYLSAYAYNEKLLVTLGQQVREGQQIATMGRGENGKIMLHFEIRHDGQPINPNELLR